MVVVFTRYGGEIWPVAFAIRNYCRVWLKSQYVDCYMLCYVSISEADVVIVREGFNR